MMYYTKVLIVEDSNAQALKLKHILQKHNYEVKHASRAEDAVLILQEYVPHIIISDIVMPGMNGFELCSFIKSKEELSSIPVILLSSLSETEDIIKGLECGADSFITKPYSEDFLLKKLDFFVANFNIRNKNKLNEDGLEVLYSGKKHNITSSQRQTINLLLSTYENSILKNKELIDTNIKLKETQSRLEKLNKNLEHKVTIRTKKIENTNAVLRAIRKINQLIIKEQNRNKLISEACNIITQTKVFQNAWIILTNDKDVIIDSSNTKTHDHISKMESDFLLKNKPVCYQKTLENDGVTIIEDVNKNCTGCPNCELIKDKSSSILSMGLRSNKNNYGMINVVLPLELSNDVEEQLLFQEIAEDIAFALHKIELEEKRTSAELEIKKRVKELQCLHRISKLSEKNNLSLTEYFHKIPTIIQKSFQNYDRTGCQISIDGNFYATSNFIKTNKVLETIIFHKNNCVGKIEVGYLKEELNNEFDKYIEKEKDLLKTIAIHIGEYIEKKKAEERLAKYHENLEYEVKERTNELSNERNLLRILIDCLPDQIYAKDNQHRFILANKNTRKILGIEETDIIIGKTDCDFLSADMANKNHQEEQKIIQNINQISYSEEFVKYSRRKTKWFSITKVPFRNSDGKIIGLVGINRDITLNKLVEINMKKSKKTADQANQAKSLFLANMSHEIRTPMNAIIGYTEILDRKINDPILKDYLTSILTSSKALLELINEILDFSKIEAGKMTLRYEFFDIRQLLTKLELLFKMKAKEKKINYTIDISPKFPNNIKLDELKLRQIAINLIGNALKFTDQGFVKLSLEASQITANKLNLIIKVSDSGIGIPDNKRNSIFGDFSQSDHNISKLYGGTGLGLSISKKIIGLFKGSIKLDSTLGKGSVFTIEIPNVSYSNTLKNKLKTKDLDPSSIKFTKSTILVVDDMKTNQEILRAHLEYFNHKVYVANNGAEGIKIAKENKPDVIFMDVKMPIMDGYEATKELRKYEETKLIPIIACTANLVNLSEKNYLAYGFSDFISKPLLLSDILHKLCRFIKWQKREQNAVITEMKTHFFDYNTSELLKQKIEPLLNSLEKKHSSKSEKELADVLMQTGEAINNAYLKDQSQKILHGIKTFNIEKVNTVIAELKTQIKNTLHQTSTF